MERSSTECMCGTSAPRYLENVIISPTLVLFRRKRLKDIMQLGKQLFAGFMSL